MECLLSAPSGRSLMAPWPAKAAGYRALLMSPGSGFAGPSSFTSLRPVPDALGLQQLWPDTRWHATEGA